MCCNCGTLVPFYAQMGRVGLLSWMSGSQGNQLLCFSLLHQWGNVHNRLVDPPKENSSYWILHSNMQLIGEWIAKRMVTIKGKTGLVDPLLYIQLSIGRGVDRSWVIWNDCVCEQVVQIPVYCITNCLGFRNLIDSLLTTDIKYKVTFCRNDERRCACILPMTQCYFYVK